MSRPAFRALVVTIVVLLPALVAAVFQQTRRAPRLFKDSRQLLAIARAQGRTQVPLIIATTVGSASAVAQRAAQLGGDIRYRDEEVGYLRILTPVDRVDALVEGDGIESAVVDFNDDFPARLTPAPQGRDTARGQRRDTIPWPPRWSDYPLRNPYRAINDIDAAGFQRKRPTYDGRGVTIAVLDGNIDFLLPEFQTAYTLDGKRVRKVADNLNAGDPREDGEDMAQWVNMKEQVTATSRRVSFHGKTLTTPHDGAFRIGVFDERRINNTAAYLDQDIDRNGNPRGDDGKFGVLWDERTNDVWVDTDRDLSFADEKPMTDYIKREDFGVFGKDNPKTQVRESVGFTVQTDPKNGFVAINVGIFQHATEIMGHVVGNREPAGRLQGVAPGARVASIYYGGTTHGMIEGLIMAFKHPLVDVVVLEQSVAIASIPYALADSRHPISIIAQRLTDRYQKLMFVPGNNAPGFGLVAEDGLAPGAVSAGGYQARESYRMNAGFEPEPADNMHWGGLGHGPSGIGALKPDLLAPSGQMSVDIGYVYRKGEQERRGLYMLPAGYFVDGGTSTAAPMAAGAAALVISAAKQNKVPWDAVRLKAALTGSARYIANLGANEQGNGLVQVEKAFELLKAMQRVQPVTITSRASVQTRLASLFATPNMGVGLYEREGWAVGDKRTRAISFTRTSGPSEPMTFAVSWLGNDGTFSSASTITLPLNRAVELPVNISASTTGSHSAIVTLDHPSIPGHAYRTLATIVVPMPLAAESNYMAKADIIVPRPGDRGLFVTVPPGATALRFSATTAGPDPVRLRAIGPEREEVNACAPNAPPGDSCIVMNPTAGVWEINASMNDMVRDFDPGRERPVKPTRVTVSATAVSIGISADDRAIPAASQGKSFDVPVTLTNRFGAVPASLGAVSLGSAFRTTRTINGGEQHVYEVTVPAGATSLRAQIADVSDNGADLDVYLFDCTRVARPASPSAERDLGNKAPTRAGPNCAPRSKKASMDRDGEVEVIDPAPGRWVIVVDAYQVPSGSTRYSYVDVFTDPRLGSVAVTDADAARAPGASWTTTAHVWMASAPDAGRTPSIRFVATNRELRGRIPAALGAMECPCGR